MTRYWNWKSAALSAASRSLVFLAANLSGGWEVALAAMQLEFIYRAVISGWFGSLSERWARREPGGQAALALLIGATVVAHIVEAILHVRSGTPNLVPSLVASVIFSVITTVFNLFAMRRGVLIAGPGRRSLGDDVRALPHLLGAFVSAALTLPDRSVVSHSRRSARSL